MSHGEQFYKDDADFKGTDVRNNASTQMTCFLCDRDRAEYFCEDCEDALLCKRCDFNLHKRKKKQGHVRKTYNADYVTIIYILNGEKYRTSLNEFKPGYD